MDGLWSWNGNTNVGGEDDKMNKFADTTAVWTSQADAKRGVGPCLVFVKTSLLRSRFWAVTQHSPQSKGSVAWQPKKRLRRRLCGDMTTQKTVMAYRPLTVEVENDLH